MDKIDFLVEAKADKERFINWLESKYESKYANNFYDAFLKLKQSIKAPYNDIYYWMKNETPEKFADYIVGLTMDSDKKHAVQQKEEEGARLVYSDKDWKVYEITNYEASAKYGKGTKWCISGSKRWSNGENGESYFNQYHEKNNIKFYFFIHGNDKYALAIYPDNQSMFEIYDAGDNKVAYIPDAPKVDEIKVKYDDNSDSNILINAILARKIDESILLKVFAEVIDDCRGGEGGSFITDADNISTWLEDEIPNGYLEHNLVENGEMTPEEYKKETGEDYEEGDWMGDMPWLSWYDIENLEGTTKKEKCDINNLKKHKYHVVSETYDGLEYNYADDWSDLILLLNDVCGLNNWTQDDIDDYFINSGEYDEDSVELNSYDLFCSMVANRLIADIKQGSINSNVLSGAGLSDNYLKSFTESLTEDVEEIEVTDYDEIVNAEIRNINDFLDEFGFEVELVNDYDFDSDALGMFLNSIQDNASVFPIALNKDAIIKGSEKYDVELDTSILTTVAHEVGHGIFEYLEDFYDLEDANEEDVVEEFARDYYDNNLSNNTLYRLLLDYQISDKEDEIIDESLLEMRGKGNISDEKILRYVDECIAEMKKINFTPNDDCLSYDDIDVEEGDAMNTFGTMILPNASSDNFKLVLNKYMFNESEKAIKNTIYHELCHYVSDKLAIDCGAFYEKYPGKWYLDSSIYGAKDYKGHGRVWKYIAQKVGNTVGQDITRTNTFDLHTEVGKHYDENVKYIVRCKHCGYEFKYNRMTNFIKEILRGNGHTHNYYCNCDDGTKGHDFEIVKGN